MDSTKPAVPNLLQHYRLDRGAVSVQALGEHQPASDDYATFSHAERMTALEFLRQSAYGYDACARRIERVIEIDSLDRR